MICECTDGMFKGIYNGKQYHKADISAVLIRAWNAGVERIIVSCGIVQNISLCFGYEIMVFVIVFCCCR